jgi:neutral ceramidase
MHHQPRFHIPFLKSLLIIAAAGLQCLAAAADTLEAGVGLVDITPTGEVTLAGSPSPKKTAEVKTRLYVRALVLASGGTKVAIVTLDTLKYPVDLTVKARTSIEQATGIPAANVIICSSHTHSGPLWSYYPDKLVTPITEAVSKAAHDLTPCTLGMARGRAEGVAECRRVIKDGHAWNRWQLKPDEADKYPAEGPADPDFDLLALRSADGKYKAILYNFACHAANNRAPLISADYPGDVELHVQKALGYAVPALFLTGACGDVNPIYSVRRDLFQERLGGEILHCLERLEPVAKPTLAIEAREFQMPGREHPEFKEEEVARNWPAQLEHYRKAYTSMKAREQPSYLYYLTGIRIGPDFAIVTNADELFCSVALGIKKQSPFKHTMTVEQTNGAHGYVPSAKGFEGGSYETWFGEHSYLTTKAADIIEKQSLEVLNKLRPEQPKP